MKALQFTEKGNFASLCYCDIPTPKAHEGQALVQVKASGLNPSDVKNVLGLFPYTTVPRVAGRDFAGVVVEGPEAWLGKEVFGCALENGFTQDGTHSEFVLVGVEALVEKPANLSFAQAASLGVPYVTAMEMLTRAALLPSSRVLILGAGAVAQAFAALAKAQGIKVIFALRSEKARKALALAGETALDIHAENLAQKVQQELGALADFVFDSTGFQLANAVSCAAPSGTLGVIAAPASGEINFPVKDFYRKGLTMIGVNSLMHNNQIGNDFLRQLVPLIRAGKLIPAQPKEIPLSSGVAAYCALKDGDSTKVVLIRGSLI